MNNIIEILKYAIFSIDIRHNRIELDYINNNIDNNRNIRYPTEIIYSESNI